jgi:hypothetical protein
MKGKGKDAPKYISEFQEQRMQNGFIIRQMKPKSIKPNNYISGVVDED